MANEKRLILADDFLDLFYVASAGQDKAFVKTVEMVVEDTPTIDAVEVVHGRWIEDQVKGFGPLSGEPYTLDVLQCSVCGEYFDVSEARNYCPNCGAKMDGGNEDG